MQSSIIKSSAAILTKSTSTGHVYQVRNHVKMYPWRRLRNTPECYLDTDRTPYSDRFNINEFGNKKVRKSWMKVIPKEKDSRFNAYTWNEAYTSSPKEAKETSQSRLDRFAQSLRERGHAREQKPYSPPPDVGERISSIYQSLESEGLNAKDLKFQLLSRCISEFNHEVPSSYLNDMSTLEDFVDYFSTEVRGINPFESLIKRDLPPNLTFLPEPSRYDKENDTLFKASALPGVISRVPGLRAGKKYPVLNQDEFQWPDI